MRKFNINKQLVTGFLKEISTVREDSRGVKYRVLTIYLQDRSFKNREYKVMDYRMENLEVEKNYLIISDIVNSSGFTIYYSSFKFNYENKYVEILEHINQLLLKFYELNDEELKSECEIPQELIQTFSSEDSNWDRRESQVLQKIKDIPDKEKAEIVWDEFFS